MPRNARSEAKLHQAQAKESPKAEKEKGKQRWAGYVSVFEDKEQPLESFLASGADDDEPDRTYHQLLGTMHAMTA